MDKEPSNKISSLQTLLQHGGSEHRVGRGILGAINQSVTFHGKKPLIQTTSQTLSSEQIPHEQKTPVYQRLGNTPNHHEVESLLKDLNGAESCIVTGSGMAALVLLCTGLLKPGDHVICQRLCYGGTYHYLDRILRQWGVDVTFADFKDWDLHKNQRTVAAFCESISNPLCFLQPIRNIAQYCQQHNIFSICDNTFASPITIRPLDFGFDFVFESATKYLNGHSDVVAGYVAGKSIYMNKLRSIHAYIGTFLPPFSATQLLRGMRTAGIRMPVHIRNAAIVSTELVRLGFKVNIGPDPFFNEVPSSLTNHQIVQDRSNFVGRNDTGDAATWVELYKQDDCDDKSKIYAKNIFSGMISVDFFHAKKPIHQIIEGWRLIQNVPSLGGTETTATLPWETTNWFMSDVEKNSLNITRTLVRLSIGLEDPDDIVRDIRNSLN